jgi:proline racemase
MIARVSTIDAHVGGQGVRLVVDGLPRLSGASMTQKRDSLRRRADDIRRAILLEPRGHANLRAAVFTEPVAPGSQAGLLFLDADGYPPFSGHALIAALTIALERGLIHGGGEVITLDTVAGSIRARAMVTTRGGAPRVESVAWTGDPAFVLAAGHAVRLGSREVRVDLAFGGLFHAIVDTEAIGIPLTEARLPDLSRLAVDICAALNSSGTIVHPGDASIAGIGAVTFTSAPQDPEAHLRNLTVSAGGRINRSPGGTSTAAVMSVLDAMGLLLEDQPFVHEGFSGTLFRGRVVGRAHAGELPAIVAEIEGSAWITGEHTFFLDEDDPCREGTP